MNDRTSGAAAGIVEAGPSDTEANGPAARPDADRMGRNQDDLIAEARALALYVSRHGDALSADQHELHEQLLFAIRMVVDEPSPSTKGWQALMTAYAKVTAVTYKERGVNGRTILDTQSTANTSFWCFRSAKNRPIGIGVLFLVPALLLELLMNWLKGCDPKKLACANDLHWLIRDKSPVCWNQEDYQTFYNSACRFWNEW